MTIVKQHNNNHFTIIQFSKFQNRNIKKKTDLKQVFRLTMYNTVWSSLVKILKGKK